MANNYHGRVNIVGELSDAQALPNATSSDSTNMVDIGDPTLSHLWIDVYTESGLTVSTGNAFSIELESYSADTAASAIPPFTKDNGGGIQGASGTAESDAHMYLIHKTSADGELAFSANDLVTQIAIPEDLLRLSGHTFVQLKYNSDEDLRAYTLTAFVYTK